MDFDPNKIQLTKIQIKILKLLSLKEKLNIYQIHGYFKFPAFTDLLIALQDLEKLKLIHGIESELYEDFSISLNGEKYILFLKEKNRKNLFAIISAISCLAGIIATALTLI
ncbi:MAG: hypothetical protein E6441_12345 [Clostridium sp.]|uniref:hypothetical protein n=1 Tax=Clostridium sp. TaxID=1506 RepID=UPI00290ECA71|nr:hypothetical protein [Clostridium sp.]MDU5211119.1 hypothetical protein [Clostridium sp.]MDU6762246.1 hypothetical protein [Clostridium sp.]